jgi:hypothetical protein
MLDPVVKNILELIPEGSVQVRTLVYLKSLLTKMATAKTEETGWRHRYELQGALNALEIQGAISVQTLDVISRAVRDVWQPLARNFVMSRMSAA